MPTPRLKAKRYRGDLTPSERHFLCFGSLIGDADGTVAFSLKRGDTWHTDLKAARAAWDDHRADIVARTPTGYVAWGAVQWDGASGRITPYDLVIDR